MSIALSYVSTVFPLLKHDSEWSIYDQPTYEASLDLHPFPTSAHLLFLPHNGLWTVTLKGLWFTEHEPPLSFGRKYYL